MAILVLIDNTDAIYQFTIIIIFITTLIFFAIMYKYSISLRESIVRQRETKESLTIRSLELESSKLRNDKLEAEKEVRVERNLRLEQKIVMKNNELVSSTMMLSQQKTIMDEIENLVTSLRQTSTDGKKTVRKLKSVIRSNSALVNQWDNFRLHFEKVHPDFFQVLQDSYPRLSQNDARHCAFIRMQLSTKEIAQLMNIIPSSVQISRVRLKKKLGLDPDQDLRTFVIAL